MKAHKLLFVQRELIATTDGKGFWSNKKADISIRKLEIEPCQDQLCTLEEIFVRVFWDPEYWNIEKDGLIYTDEGFRDSLSKKLCELYPGSGIDWSNLHYTEQGMQGKNFVHMIIGCW